MIMGQTGSLAVTVTGRNVLFVGISQKCLPIQRTAEQ